MSAEQFQQRLSDLIFSAREHIKELERAQTESENQYKAWEDAEPGEESEDAHSEWQDKEPEVIDNSKKVEAIEAAIADLESAVEKLDKALDDE